jgi:hypothetical protein
MSITGKVQKEIATPLNVLRLQKVHLATQQAMSQREIENLGPLTQIDLYTTYIADTLVWNLKTYILGLEDEKIVCHREWPEDWWQALRERWFPRWWLRRWPVLVKVHHREIVSFKAVCPHLNIKVERQELHLQWLAGMDLHTRDDNERL